jgi:hypothetical protein
MGAASSLVIRCTLLLGWGADHNRLGGQAAGPLRRQNPSSSNVSGRDRTCDLVDCCSYRRHGQMAGQAAFCRSLGEVCNPFGIEIVLHRRSGRALQVEITYSPGDTVMSLIRKLCRMRGLMPTSRGNGRLVLTGLEPPASRGRLWCWVKISNPAASAWTIPPATASTRSRANPSRIPKTANLQFFRRTGPRLIKRPRSLALLVAQQSARPHPWPAATDDRDHPALPAPAF